MPLDFLRLHLVGFGQNIQHGQYTDILEISSCFLIYLADVEVLAQSLYMYVQYMRNHLLSVIV